MYLSGWIRFWVIISIPIMEILFYGHLHISLILIFCRVLDGIHKKKKKKNLMDDLIEPRIIWVFLFRILIHLYNEEVDIMTKLLKILGLVLLFAILVEFSPLIILVVMLAIICSKGSLKDRIIGVIDKIKRMIEA